jgi:ABC-type bacteriocin/lantibiotic exporter with double-glycine peptidase domain
MAMAESILIIILCVVLLVFLVLAIVAVAIVIGILRNLKRISQRAEETTENLSGILMNMGKRLGPMAASAVLEAIFKRFKGKKTKDEGNKDEE